MVASFTFLWEIPWKREMQCKKRMYLKFWLVFLPAWYCPLRTGVGLFESYLLMVLYIIHTSEPKWNCVKTWRNQAKDWQSLSMTLLQGPQEKVKMHKVKISFFFSFDRRKISAWLEPQKYEFFLKLSWQMFLIYRIISEREKLNEW